MTTRIERSTKELFRPQPDRTPVYACGLLFLVVLFGQGLAGPALLAAFVALIVMACRDHLTAHWLWRRDPDRARARACCCFCLSRGTLKLTAAATIPSLVVYRPLTWHEAIGWHVPTALLSGIVVHIGFAITGNFLAARSGVRVWIDSGLHTSRKRSVWPPKCLGTTNQLASIWPTAVTCVVIVFLFGLETLARTSTEIEIPVGCAIVGLAAGMIAWTARSCAVIPEECWYRQADYL
jgi:hypothetical protein